MTVDCLIIGQGISGTMLSWFLHKEGKSFLVIDERREGTASLASAGNINPVTGRRYAVSWMIEVLMPFALQTYEELSRLLEVPLVAKKSVIEFFTTPQMRHSFLDRLAQDDTYLHTYPDQNHFNPYFNYEFGCGEISPAMSIHVTALLDGWRKKLKENNQLLEQVFESEKLSVEKDSVQYGDIVAGKVIFCEGPAAMENPWFNLLPFALNKGEALIIEAPELTDEHIFKRGLTLTPLPEKGLFWAGSSFQWDYTDNLPSEQFLQQTTAFLKHWIRVPFKVLEHRSAIRPATVERRPFAGFHPVFDRVGILNGMGTKGTSLAPFLAYQLVQHLVSGLPLTPDVDVHRFSRILSK
jgi:glycine/D-amino acid oxidase-like deaminating enzyme